MRNSKDEKNGLIFSSFDNMNKAKSRNNYLNTNIFLSSEKIKEVKDNNNVMHTIFETIEPKNLNINDKINDKENNNIIDINLIQENNQRYLSPTSSFINKNDNKKMMNILPLLKKENNLMNKRKTNMKKKLMDNKVKIN